MHLAIGVILLAVPAVLSFFGLPKRNGGTHRFLQFEATIRSASTAHYNCGPLGAARVITALSGKP